MRGSASPPRGGTPVPATRPPRLTGWGLPIRKSGNFSSKFEGAGLIAWWKLGRVHYCRMPANPLRHAGDWIEQQRLFWEQQFDALNDFLSREYGTWTTQRSDDPTPPSDSGAGSVPAPSGSSTRGPGHKR